MDITKKEFVNIINQLKDANDFYNKSFDLVREYREKMPGLEFYEPGIATHEDLVVYLLKKVANDKDDWINYFCWDCDFGRAEDLIASNELKDQIRTPEELYDYLEKNYGKSK